MNGRVGLLKRAAGSALTSQIWLDEWSKRAIELKGIVMDRRSDVVGGSANGFDISPHLREIILKRPPLTQLIRLSTGGFVQKPLPLCPYSRFVSCRVVSKST